jgi:hypothetical protein
MSFTFSVCPAPGVRNYVDMAQILKTLPASLHYTAFQSHTQHVYLPLASAPQPQPRPDPTAVFSGQPSERDSKESAGGVTPGPVQVCTQEVSPLTLFPTQKKEGGLARLVRLVLGATLDKREQISNWARRPLRPEQLHYAGLDALSQVLVVDHLEHRLKLLQKTENKSADLVAAGSQQSNHGNRGHGQGHAQHRTKKSLLAEKALARQHLVNSTPFLINHLDL